MRATRAIRAFRCRAISTRRSGRNSAGVEFGDRASLEALLAGVQSAAPLPQAEGRTVARRRWRRRRGRLCGVERHAGRGARRRAGARRRSLRAPSRCADRAAAIRRRQDARRCARRSARGGRFLPLLRGAGAPHARARAHAGPDRRDQRAASIAGAACSSASARGIFRSRSSSARSWPRSSRAIPSSPSPPSRRR